MRRARITITLNNDIVNKIDSLVDNKHIRNRSHAIEYILTQYCSSHIETAVILAGGKGTKLSPYPYEIPKSLLPIQGKPILENLIMNLKKSNITKIVICIGYLGEKIKEYFGNGEKFGVRIVYSEEKTPLQTGGALLAARRFLPNTPFVLLHGDIVTDLSFSDVIDFHKKQDSIATIALTSVNAPLKFGQLKLHGTKLTSFFQKSHEDQIESHLVNCGIYIFEPDIFSYFPPKQKAGRLEDVIEKLIKERKVSGFVFEGQWFDVGLQYPLP